MERFGIEKLLWKKGLWKFTGTDFQESKNLCQKRGSYCEQQVLKYFERKNFHLVTRNFKIAGIEIDLILKKKHWLLVEVKSLSNVDQIHFRLNIRQKLRLQRARRIFEDKKVQPVELRVVYVLPSETMIDLSIEDHLNHMKY